MKLAVRFTISILFIVAWAKAETGGHPCNFIDCPPGALCDAYRGDAYCIPHCDAYFCDHNAECEMIQVQCFTDPCWDVPECSEIVEENPCNLIDCAPGRRCETYQGETYCNPHCDAGFCTNRYEKCEMIQLQCFTDPCWDVPQCSVINECSSHTDCNGIDAYCDNSGACWEPCSSCPSYDDSIDGTCPTCEYDGPDAACSNNEWQCTNGECIRDSYECDHRSDCSDYSDEDSHCNASTNSSPTPITPAENPDDHQGRGGGRGGGRH